MSFTKQDVILHFKLAGIVPVFHHPDVDVLMNAVDVSYKCGLRVFEFMHQRDNKGLRLFNYIRERAYKYPGIVLGVGTVLDATMTERYLQIGAQFIASPFIRPEMASICNEQDILWMPGCTTASDVAWARALGASVISVLPANILGPEFIRTVKSENPDLEFIPSGIVDIDLASLTKWFHAGAMCIKLSAPLFPKEAITAKDWSSIEKGIFGTLKNITKIRSTLKPVNPASN